jgi:hypothetical protein
MALALAASLGLAGCGGSRGNSSNEEDTAGGGEAHVTRISQSTGLRIFLNSRMEDLRGPYPLCALSAEKPDPIGREIHIVAIPLQAGEAAAILNNRYTSEERPERRYPGISPGANSAIALGLSGADYAVFEKGSSVGRVPSSPEYPPYYVAIVDEKWFISLMVPHGYLETRLVEPVSRDIARLLESGEISCR